MKPHSTRKGLERPGENGPRIVEARPPTLRRRTTDFSERPRTCRLRYSDGEVFILALVQPRCPTVREPCGCCAPVLVLADLTPPVPSAKRSDPGARTSRCNKASPPNIRPGSSHTCTRYIGMSRGTPRRHRRSSPHPPEVSPTVRGRSEPRVDPRSLSRTLPPPPAAGSRST